MRLSKVQVAIVWILAGSGVAGVALQLLLEQQGRRELVSLRTANATSRAARLENLELRKVAAELAQLRRDDAEFSEVRFHALAMQAKLAAAASLAQTEPVAVQASGPVMPVRKITVSSGLPRSRNRITPIYPANLRADGIGGRVEVSFTVDNDGNVIDPEVISSTHPEFEFAVLEAVRKWQYQPTTRSDQASQGTFLVPVTFVPERGRITIGAGEQVRPGAPIAPPPPDWF